MKPSSHKKQKQKTKNMEEEWVEGPLMPSSTALFSLEVPSPPARPGALCGEGFWGLLTALLRIQTAAHDKCFLNTDESCRGITSVMFKARIPCHRT